MSSKPSAPFSSSYKTRQQPSGEPAPTRSKLSKEASDNLLSYYSSPIADEGRDYSRQRSTEKPPPNRAKRASAVASTSSSSDYSDDSEVTDARDIPSEASSSVTRRSGTPSKGGADKRRIAIVQMDPVNDTARKSTSDTASSSNSIRSRRGNANSFAGLALVAPPDAAVRSYTQLTPPSTAPPAAADYRSNSHLMEDHENGPHRSSSANPAGRLSRDDTRTGSVGSTQSTRAAVAPILPANNDKTKKNTKPDDKNNPILAPLDVSQRSATSPSSSLATHSEFVDRGRNVVPPLDRMTSPQMMSPLPVVTPSIGEEKDIDKPVAGPVVVKLDNLASRTSHSTASWRSDSPTPSHGSASNHGSTYSSSATSSYLRYEPGVHATAGPLPPPPRAMFNIDVSTPPPPRPPRLHSPITTPTASRIRGDMEAVKQALQLPPSVSAVLASKLSTPPPVEGFKAEEDKKEAEKGSRDDKGKAEEAVSNKQANESSDQELSRTTSIHRREAATLSNSTSSDASSVLSPEDKQSSRTSTDDLDESVPVVVVAPPRPDKLPPTPIDHSKFDKWLSENPEVAQYDTRRSTSFDERRESPERSLSTSAAGYATDAPSPPPKSLRTSLTNNLKRFSALPRTPSLSSKSGNRTSGSTRYTLSRTPSPSIPISPRPAFKKIKSSNPAALFCHEVHGQNTTLQRCAIYAAKINELYIHDCGLMEWLDDTKTRGPNTHSQRGPSTQPFTPQPRQTSRSSMISDATFPIRPDASVATDLLQGAYRDITPTGMPPLLPYPSLALNPPPASTRPTRSQSSASSATATASIRSLAPTPSLKGGFFASLGRKASMSSGRKDKFLPTISNPISVAVSPPVRTGSHTSAQFHRSSNSASGTPPSAPGGPRAPPHRAQRSQTFMASASATSPSERSGHEELTRRPSLFNLGLDTVIDIHPDPDFSQQVDKLHELLPQADRDILAGYLRHAGQDMLAIGQYLEDERMGTIQRF